MGFFADTPIVTQAEVEAITHEGGLENLDTGSATLAALLPQATNALIRELKKRGADPFWVTNVQDFKEVASLWILATIFDSQPQGDEENQRKAQHYRQRFEKEIKEIFIELDPTKENEASLPDKGLPTVVNLDSEPSFMRPTDTRRPGEFLGPYWATK